jgi:amidohydrolase
VTLAEILAAHREAMPGPAVFLFQPAEETFSGAKPMVEAGALEDPHVDEVYALHLTTQSRVGWVQCTPGASMASADFFDITIRGVGGHGAYPHMSVDPITAAAQIVTGLQSLVSREVHALQPAVMTVGQVVAGSKHNVIPDEAVLRGSIRAFDAGVREQLIERLAAFAEETARAHRATATIDMCAESCPPSVNDEAATVRARTACESEFGRDNVGPGLPVMASDDMALFLQERPGCYMRVGAAPEGKPTPPHHNSSFEIDERSLAIGLRAALAVMTSALETPD